MNTFILSRAIEFIRWPYDPTPWGFPGVK